MLLPSGKARQMYKRSAHITQGVCDCGMVLGFQNCGELWCGAQMQLPGSKARQMTLGRASQKPRTVLSTTGRAIQRFLSPWQNIGTYPPYLGSPWPPQRDETLLPRY